MQGDGTARVFIIIEWIAKHARVLILRVPDDKGLPFLLTGDTTLLS